MSEKYLRQLHAVCNAASAALILVDEHRQCIFMNAAAHALTGYSMEEMAGRELHSLLHHRHGSAYSEQNCPISQAFVAREARQGEEVLVHKNGNFYDVAYTATPVWDGHQLLGLVVEIRDISDQKMAERDLQSLRGKLEASVITHAPPAHGSEHSRFLGNTLANLRSIVFVWDRQQRFVYANRELEQVSGLEAKHYLGKNLRDLHYPEELVELLGLQFRQVLENRQPVRNEVPYTSPSGAREFYEYTLSPVIAEDGSVDYVAGVARNTTERHNLESALKVANEQLEKQVEESSTDLQHSEARYRTLFNSIDQAFCLIELLYDETGHACDYRLLETNTAWEQIMGLSGATGKKISQVLPNFEMRWIEFYDQVARSGTPRRREFVAKALANRALDMYVFPADTANSARVALLFSDVTERRRAQDELERAYDIIEGITEGSEHLIAAQDLDFRFIYVNDSYFREYHELWDHELQVGDSMLETLAPWPLQLERARELWSRAMAGETFAITMDFGPTPAKTRTYDQRFNPIRNSAGCIIGAAHTLLDVTHQVRYQKALRESEERYRLISRATNDVIWDWDLTSDQIRWNEAVKEHFGCSPAELGNTIDSWYDRIHPDDAERVVKRIHTAIESSAETWSDEYRFRISDGSYAVFLDRGFIARDDKGHGYRMIGSMLDLTKRREAEEALHRTAELDAYRLGLSDAIRPLEDPVAIQREASRVLGEYLGSNRVSYSEISADGEFLVVQIDYHTGVPSASGSYRLKEYGQLLVQEFTAGHTVVVRNVLEDDRLDVPQRQLTLAGGAQAYVAVPLIKGGRPVAALIVSSAEPRNWEDTEIKLMVETAERTWAAVERAQVENALRVSEQRFRVLTDGIPHIVWLTDPDGNFEFVNRQFSEFTGRPAVPMSGETVLKEFIHPDDRAATIDAWLQARSSRRAYRVEHRLRASCGEYRWAVARAEPQIGDDNAVAHWFGTTTDIHDRKIAEQTLQDADRQKDEFLAMLAHELRNPLAAVRNVERLLAPKVGDDLQARRHMDILRRQTATLNELVEELLDVSRITRGLVELKLEVVDLTAAARNALESVQGLMDSKDHQVEVSLPTEPLPVRGDQVRLEQILVNLLTNAAKYTDPGGEIALHLSREGTRAYIAVTDNGIGISADVINRIFTLFGQAERGLDRAQGGLGIGLTIVKNLVELHGGNINAHSAGLGRGAEFRVVLPLAPVGTVSPPETELETPAKSTRRQILLVEDNPDVAETLAQLLQFAGHEVVVVNDGTSALAKVEELEPELILLDIGLPEMDGYELARRLRQHPHAKKVVMAALTGYGQPDDRARAEAAGFDAHFVKPVDFAALERFISSVHTDRN